MVVLTLAGVQAVRMVVNIINGRQASRVEICTGGRLFGDVETKCLVVQEGATFDGNSRMGGQRPDAPAAAK